MKPSGLTRISRRDPAAQGALFRERRIETSIKRSVDEARRKIKEGSSGQSFTSLNFTWLGAGPPPERHAIERAVTEKLLALGVSATVDLGEECNFLRIALGSLPAPGGFENGGLRGAFERLTRRKTPLRSGDFYASSWIEGEVTALRRELHISRIELARLEKTLPPLGEHVVQARADHKALEAAVMRLEERAADLQGDFAAARRQLAVSKAKGIEEAADAGLR